MNELNIKINKTYVNMYHLDNFLKSEVCLSFNQLKVKMNSVSMAIVIVSEEKNRNVVSIQTLVETATQTQTKKI